MSQLTRCPNCATTFRVSDTQLQSRGGRVRCGHCSFVFNAKACLVDADPITIIDIGHESGGDDETEAFPRTEPGRPIASRRAATPRQTPEPSEPGTPPATQSEAPDWLNELEELPPPTWLRQPSVTENEAVRSAPAPADAPPPAAPAAFEDEEFIPAQVKPLRVEGNRRSGTKNRKARRRKTPSRTHAGRPADDSWLKPTGLSPWRWVRRAAYGVLALCAALLAALIFRQPLVEVHPAARPWLVRACAVLGCGVEAPHHADLLVLDGVEFSFDPQRPDVLELNGVLRNDAGYEQSWPLLDVQLLDAQGQRVARRFVRPAVYLSPAERSQPAFPARTEVQLAIRLHLNGLAVENYRVAIVYP